MEYFLDMDKKYNDYRSASVVLLPVPYDGTSTFVKGADKGPQAIIDASDSIELYDVEEDIEIYGRWFITCGYYTCVLAVSSGELEITLSVGLVGWRAGHGAGGSEEKLELSSHCLPVIARKV